MSEIRVVVVPYELDRLLAKSVREHCANRLVVLDDQNAPGHALAA